MFWKLVLLLFPMLSILSSCSVQPRALYEISDEDAKKWAISIHQAGQCLYPEKWEKKIPLNLNQVEKNILNNIIYNRLSQIIGVNNTNIILRDKRSEIYADNKYYQFYSSYNKVNFDMAECKKLRKDYKQAVKVLTKQIKDQQRKIALEKKKRQIQAAKEKAAREKFYATPEGQKFLLYKEMEQKKLAAQKAYQQQLLRQQAAYQEQQAVQQALNNITQSLKSVTPTRSYSSCSQFGSGKTATFDCSTTSY